jgi:hypothetical protein
MTYPPGIKPLKIKKAKQKKAPKLANAMLGGLSSLAYQ